MSYIQRHKYLLLAFFALILISAISGYALFTTPNSLNTTQINSDKNVTQSFSFDDETSEVNLNIQTFKHTNTTTIEQSDSVDNNLKITNTKDDVEKPKTYNLKPITLLVQGEEYTTELDEQTTVYELMQTLSASSVKPFSFSGQDYGAGMGYFVTEINGIKNDPQAGEYWIYYINDESAQVGISNYIINKGDKIEWKYENTF